MGYGCRGKGSGAGKAGISRICANVYKVDTYIPPSRSDLHITIYYVNYIGGIFITYADLVAAIVAHPLTSLGPPFLPRLTPSS
jgi:hypothetical protein